MSNISPFQHEAHVTFAAVLGPHSCNICSRSRCRVSDIHKNTKEALLKNISRKNLQSSNDKKGRLFYVYTSKKTTTVFSASTCYVTATTVTACTRRKKKSIIADLYDEDADISFDTVTRYWIGYMYYIRIIKD